MYNNLIYFLLVLLVFTTYQPEEVMPSPWWVCVILNLLLALGFWQSVRMSFARFYHGLSSIIGGGPSLAYTRRVTRLSILSIVVFALAVYLLGLKDLIAALPLIGNSSALTGLLGLICFAGYLSVIWREAYPSYKRIFRTELSRNAFVRSQLRFNLPIILPYVLVTLILDILGWLSFSWVKIMLDSPLGETLLVLVLMGIIVIILPLLIRNLWGLKPLPGGGHREAIESFCKRHGFKVRDIMLWPLYEGEALTAGVMGMVSRWRYILITHSLLRILTREELEAVLGHELGHVKHRHLFLYFFFFVGFLIFVLAITPIGFHLLLSTEWGVNLVLAASDMDTTYLALLSNAPYVLLMILYFRFILGAFLRNYERQADLFAYRLTGSIQGLVGSLNKIAFHSGQSRNLPSWHHYSVAQRVDFLEACEKDPSLIQRHQSKVRRMLGVYILCLFLAGWAGHAMTTGQMGEETLRKHLHSAQAYADRHPDNFEVQWKLGNIYFALNDLRPAALAFERAMDLKPDDPEVINSLAWVLSILPDATDEEKNTALLLARRAVELDPSSHILDTLAEAYFVNGKYREAVKTIDRAFTASGPLDDHEYLERQRLKFEQALR